jgi:AcrR family transcriptional regulator
MPNVKGDEEARGRLSRGESQARTRSALLDAAEQAFIERGFLGASIEAITERAGFSRGAFYSNFDSKEQLFAELLQDRVYGRYRQMAEDSADPASRPSLREAGERLAAIQAEPAGQWLFRLWLELLAHAGRDPEFRRLAAGFWSGTRDLTAAALEQLYREAGAEPPAPPQDLATSMIALDIGLALQHFVDPDGAPLDLYPRLYETIFGPLSPGA